MSFHLRVVTPERILAEYEATSVSLPTSKGEITILQHHIPFASLLAAGALRIVHEDKTEEVVVAGGFVEVAPETRMVTVLADFAERSEELNIASIEEAKRRAEKVMREAARNDDVQFAAAAAALEKELARYRVAARHRSSRGIPMGDHSSPKDETRS